MNHLDVGLDKGRSKTNLAVARADGHLLLEARIEHFDQLDPQPITESRLLHLLITHTGQVLTTDMIIERVWGYDEAGDSGLVKTHIRHLRQKVEPDPNSPQYIMTVPGVGYTFTAPITIES